MATFKQVADKFGVEEAQVEELKWAMQDTWGTIGYDYLEAFGSEREAIKAHGSEAAMVAEATLDADRITTFNPNQDLSWVYRTANGERRTNCLELGEAAWTARSATIDRYPSGVPKSWKDV